MLEERYALAAERIKEIMTETAVQEEFVEYFQKTASYVKLLADEYQFIKQGGLAAASLSELQQHNRELYADILPPSYETSYANPAYAVRKLGNDYGQLLSFLYTELRSAIEDVYEQQLEAFVIRIELFLEIYAEFACAAKEGEGIPEYETLRQNIYWFVSDYSELQIRKRCEEQINPACDFAVRIIMDNDLNDIRYLYYYGEYITDNVIKTAKHLAHIGEAQVRLMADTYTEGYRIGFEVGGKDITRKKTVNIRYALGFEKMIRQAVLNFEEMGLRPTAYRASRSTFYKHGVHKIGYYGAEANKQYEYDHKEDEALYLDRQLNNRRLEVLESALEHNKEWAAVHGGPAVVEIFGETPFVPVNKPEAPGLSEAQQKLSVEYASASGELVNAYMKGEERSFTIIAFPVPEIGPQFEAVFDEVIRINTLDYALYQSIQQTMIDTLNLGEYVFVRGMNGNQTDMKVALWELTDPDREDAFENCVADVNIPVGEVFTSPKLSGTEGVLHVSRVFLNGLEYKNLRITFEEGMITDYTCTNFTQEDENRRYIRDNVLFHHDTLPLGEFAIGTNTTAYVAAKKFAIEDKLPILIAEKMGPHFAVGDTCYSHTEDVKVYNPNGKEIVARDNAVSRLRGTDPAKAYFNCHTDITIPYDELGEVTVVTGSGDKIEIIRDGRFVLAGCEELNRPFL